MIEIRDNETFEFDLDDNNNLHGVFKYFRNKELRAVINFEHGYEHGEFYQVDMDGLPIRSGIMKYGSELDIHPDEYPTNPEQKTMFVLKYGNLPLLNQEQTLFVSNHGADGEPTIRYWYDEISKLIMSK